ncbi:MAG TPA: heavy metal-associated domain-containing protein [Spirochaetota bacterium]|nr:heavy metal-associated domain-containing protein [Spirochaetota bacterium]HPC43016.1 heavy metal-associated domain-containing protein [Spirochaetota bacterium]HPL17003.1 heavy metal-associated domain-containing protein [Spirochaetota bacterium]HQF10407.1 heavy metal-associated domain-containing protein [Spirochaetota bacterium]HQH99280.1 heavy metal-associated domain-containing protein [Spirochaetota bacterium]
MLVTKELTSANMRGGYSKTTIENAVNNLGGIESVVADPYTKRVTVEFDESTLTVEDIRHTIEDAGYEAEIEADSMQ